jgi:hypothetical protein
MTGFDSNCALMGYIDGATSMVRDKRDAHSTGVNGASSCMRFEATS